MSNKPTVTQLNITLTGTIGESTPLFSQRLNGIREITLDMGKVGYISSIGVKAWIVWTLRIPSDCQVTLVNTPYVIASQASMILGFVNDKMKIQSMQAPYLCAACGAEENRTLLRGTHYQYQTSSSPKWIRLPEKETCTKCREHELEPDIIIEKTFKFLDIANT